MLHQQPTKKEKKLISKELENLDYKQYLEEFPIHELLGLDLTMYGNVEGKKEQAIYATVDPNNKTPFATELDDLVRLHFWQPREKLLPSWNSVLANYCDIKRRDCLEREKLLRIR